MKKGSIKHRCGYCEKVLFLAPVDRGFFRRCNCGAEYKANSRDGQVFYTGCRNEVEVMTTAEIRNLRRAMGLNASDFGTLVGVSGRTIEDWEQGRRSPSGPARKILAQLAKSNPPHHK